MKNQKHQLLRL